MHLLVGFVSRLEWNKGPNLILNINNNLGVHLPFRMEKERVGSLPRRVEQFTSRLELKKKGQGSPPRCVEQFALRLELKKKGLVLHLDISSKKPALLNSVHLSVWGRHRPYYTYPIV